jgi:PAS domain S-box-containing protein
MAKKNHLKLNFKFNLLISCVLVILFLLTAYLTYHNQQGVAQKVALEQSRNISRELSVTFNHMSKIVRNEPETNYSLVPQVLTTQIAKKISADDRYSIRQVSLNFRNPDNRPDKYETEQLKAFATSDTTEIYRVIKEPEKDVFRYMQVMIAEPSCLHCHGTFESAPPYIQQRFPQDHPSYNYKVGDITGAISVVMPMTDLYEDVASGFKKTLYYRAGILVLVVIVTWFFVRRFIIAPIQSASNTIHRITSTGNLKERIPPGRSPDEIGQLLLDFNTMMDELNRTTLQRQESEDRYRSLIEAAHSAVLTFLENGNIVISNQKAEQLFGLSRSRLLGEIIFNYIEDNGVLKAKVDAFSKSAKRENYKETIRCKVRDGGGKNMDMEITLILASAIDNTPMFTAIFRISE